MKRLTYVVFALALLWIVALLQRGLPLGLDEIEYFRATRWTALGQLPYRDFWEHHTPLQWLLFAPFARLADGAGAGAIVFMRWVQLPLWVAVLWLCVRIARREGIESSGWALSLLLPLLSFTFVQRAIEYRVDVTGNAFFVAGLFAVTIPARSRWILFGAFMSAAVLANMRHAPLVIFTGLMMLFWRPKEGRWKWNPAALAMIVGVLAVAAGFLAYLQMTSSLNGFIEGVIGYNRLSSDVLAVSTFASALFAPFVTLDLPGMVFWIAGAAGIVLALRGIREPGPLQIVALLALAGIVTVAAMQVHYDYHFQNVWILMIPLAGLAFQKLPSVRWRAIALAAGVAGLVGNVAQTAPAFGASMHYQDAIMKGADRWTAPGEAVLDGSGFALRRRPAWRYWFLTTGVRFLAASGKMPRYDVAQISANPPAAIIADYRWILYSAGFPRLQNYALRHYVPLYRNLWVPGMTVMLEKTPGRFVWVAPRAGRYDVHVSDLLAKHPWFTQPMGYVTTIGPQAAVFEIPLDRLPQYGAASLQWMVDGHALPAHATSLDLRKGSRVELTGIAQERAGLLLVPHGITTLCSAPEEEVVF